jgi:hypothetical protein
VRICGPVIWGSPICEDLRNLRPGLEGFMVLIRENPWKSVAQLFGVVFCEDLRKSAASLICEDLRNQRPILTFPWF